VRVDGTLVATLDAGETHSFVPTTPMYVETSLPALVWMNGSRGSCELDAALIPPLELVALPLAITFNSSFTGEAAAVIPTGEVSTLTLDGAAIVPTSSVAVPGRTDITVVVFDVTAALHTVSASHGFQLLAASAGAGAGILAYFGPFVSCTADTMCEDVGPCTVETCVMNACVTTPVEAGMAGDCEGGLVCSADGSCTDAEPMDAGMPDGGATDAGPLDAGPRDAGRVDGGAPPGDGGGTGSGDAGTMVETDGGCCSVVGARSDRGPLALAFLAGLGLVIARRQKKRAARSRRT
jgi:hypothetical protein